MTQTDINKINEAIFKKLNPDGCLHGLESELSALAKGTTINQFECIHCGQFPAKIPSYHTPEGTQNIKAWLIKEGKWREFTVYAIREFNCNRGIKNVIRFTFNIATDPSQFAQQFYEYIEEEEEPNMIEVELTNKKTHGILIGIKEDK